MRAQQGTSMIKQGDHHEHEGKGQRHCIETRWRLLLRFGGPPLRDDDRSHQDANDRATIRFASDTIVNRPWQGCQLSQATMIAISDGLPPTVILSIFFMVVTIMTNILSNQATAILFTPIAISLAQVLKVDVNAFIFAVIFATNCCFATPFAYQTNILVMTPGQYKFNDYIKLGAPLILIIWALYTVIAPLYFGF